METSYNVKFNAAEAMYVIKCVSYDNKDFAWPKTKDKGEIIAYLFGQNAALRAKLNKEEN